MSITMRLEELFAALAKDGTAYIDMSNGGRVVLLAVRRNDANNGRDFTLTVSRAIMVHPWFEVVDVHCHCT